MFNKAWPGKKVAKLGVIGIFLVTTLYNSAFAQKTKDFYETRDGYNLKLASTDESLEQFSKWEFDRTGLDLELPVTYEDLCSYDRYCKRLKTHKQEFIPPSEITLAIFQRIRSMIFDVAKKFNVDPVLLMAVIVTEHTLNVNIVDIWQTELVRTPLGKDGSFASLEFSYGYGQIYAKAAARAEKIVAKIEDRPEKSQKEIAQSLLSMKGALTYAAGIIVDMTRVYQKHGFDISHQPGILATIYNLGNPEERAVQTSNEGREPQVNFFGWYVLKNWKLFEEVLLKRSNDLKISNALLEGSKIVNKKWGVRTGKDLYPAFVTEKPISLFMRPERCLSKKFDYENHSYDSNSFSGGLSHERISRDDTGVGFFEILEQALDCNGREWSMVRTQKESVGWLSHNELGSGFSVDYFSRTCRPNDRLLESCLDQAKALDPRVKVLAKDPQNETSAKLEILGFRDQNLPPTTSGFHQECLDESNRKSWAEREKERRENEIARPFRPSYNAADPKEIEKEQKRKEAARQKQIDSVLKDGLHNSGMALVPATLEELDWIDQEVKRFKREFLKLSGLKVWGSVYEKFFKIDDIVRSIDSSKIEACRKSLAKSKDEAECYISSHQIFAEFFSRLNIDTVRDLKKTEDLYLFTGKIVFERVEFLNLVHANDVEVEARKAQWSNLDFDTQLRLVEKSCAPLFEKFSKVKIRYEEFLIDLGQYNKESYYNDLRFSLGHLEKAIASCEAYHSRMTTLDSDLETAPVINFSFPIGKFFYWERSFILVPNVTRRITTYNENSYRTLSPEHFSILKIDEEFVEEALLILVEILHNQVTTFKKDYDRWLAKKVSLPEVEPYGSWQSCLYDPLATAELINKLSELSCVQMVQIMDESSLVSRVALSSDKVVGVDEKDMTNYFKLFVKPRCSYDSQ